MPAKKPKADDLDADDRPRKKKAKPAKSNLGLILGVVGCGGLLLVVCLVGAGGGGYWYYAKSEPPKNKDAVVQNKDKPPAPGKDGAKVGKDDKTKPPPAGTKLKKSYEQIPLGAKFDKVVELMGNRGRGTAPSTFPRLADAALEKLIASKLRDHGVNILYEWADASNDPCLVVGYNEDVVAFKGYYYGPDGSAQVEYVFDPAQLKKKSK